MDEHRLDTLAKGLAAPATRRTAVRGLAVGGLLGALGLARADTTARAAPPTCTLAFTATVRLGPSAGQVLPGATQPGVLQGQLSLGLTAGGAIDGGSLRLPNGTSLPVVGQVDGRALELRIAVGQGMTLVAAGVAEQAIAACQGAVDGVVSGPRAGDLGDWHATAGGGAGGTGTAGASPTNPAASAAGVAPLAVTAPAATRQPTTAPTAAATAGAAGACAAGQTTCGDQCVDLTGDDLHCGACDHACKPLYEQCIDGACATIDCGTGLTNCSGYCADLSTDANHCGACGTACLSGQGCADGTCKTVLSVPQPPANPPVLKCTGTLCGPLCVDTSSDTANCGACGVVCGQAQVCTAGACENNI